MSGAIPHGSEPPADEVSSAARYDAEYFASHCGVPYERGDHGWEEFFGSVADAIVEQFAPRTVLDAGCAIGFLVEALRDRGVDAEGVDISEYAIEQAPDELRPNLRVASVTEELERDYDMITCIEVLEHVAEDDAPAVVANFARHTDRVLFSSTPDDQDEQTHVNVRPSEYWVELFAQNGFFRAPETDAGFVTPHAIVFERSDALRFAMRVETLVRTAREREVALEDEKRSIQEEKDALARSNDELEGEREAAEQRCEELERRRSDLFGQVEALKTVLLAAERDAAEWHAWQERGGFRLFTALVGVRMRVAPPGTRRDRATRATLRAGASLVERRIARPSLGRAHRMSGRRAVLFVSGCPGDAYRYRCQHQAAELGYAGTSAEAALFGEVDLLEAVERYQAFVLHRVAWDATVGRFVERARARGKPVIFDTDDLVFDPEAVPFVAALAEMSEAERTLFEDGIHRYRRTLQEIGQATVSTESLRDAAARVVDRAVVSPNVVSSEMLFAADEALADPPERTRGETVIGYLSGTRTHNRDFLEAADAVLWALETYPGVEFVAVGHIDLDERFDAFGERVARIALQPWQQLPALLTGIDINLAPLEPDNPFTEAKSCLKYLEAALVGIPTVASPRSDFVRVVESGANGVLAESPGEWREALRLLVEEPEKRRELGAAAQLDARTRHTVRSGARAFHRAFAGLAGERQSAPLTVNWILRAPIATRGGGYRAIFRLANALGRAGHKVRVYVEPIAHLAGRSNADILDFVEEAFGPLAVEVVVGHHSIAAADVSIATNWPTASTVADHDRSLFRAYFVQDYEPDFYEDGDPLRWEADATYYLPLRHISYGRHLAERIRKRAGVEGDAVDFALEPEFALTTPPEARTGPPGVLFLARPDQRRRGFDTGIEALRLLHERRPEVDIRLFGSTDAELPVLPFPARNLGVLTPDALAAELNEAHVFLSFSLTNISHAPFEAMACGCAVVEADLPQVRAMLRPGAAVLAALDPDPIAAALEDLVGDDGRRIALARRGIEATASMSWDRTAQQFERLLQELAFVRLEQEAE